MKKLAYTMLVFAVLSCKEEKKEPIVTEPVKVDTVIEDNEDYFTLSIKAIVENDDKIVLYYLEEDQKNITNENSVQANVTGGVSSQDIILKLKEDILPTKLVLKYGIELQEQKIQFVDAVISYEGETIEMDAYKFYQFFIPNDFVEYNQDNHIATSKAKNGEHKPVFFSRKVLEDKLDYTFY